MDSKPFVASKALQDVLDMLALMKSEGRTPRDRYIAVAITDLEKVVAYVEKYVEGKGKS